jgi:hypothetical protein
VSRTVDVGGTEHDHRDAALAGAVLVDVIAGVEVDGLVPQPLSVGAFGLAGDVLAAAPGSEDLDPGMGPDVVVPGGVAERSRLRGDQDEVVAVGDEDQGSRAFLAGAGPARRRCSRSRG